MRLVKSVLRSSIVLVVPGAPGFRATWAIALIHTTGIPSLLVATNGDVLTLGMGFSPAKKYQCIFSSVSNTSIFTIFNASAAINSSTLNCGPCPTKPDSTSPFQSFFNVNFSLTIYEVNATNNATGMFVPSWGSSFVSYVPCNNGILDNTETGQ